MRPSIISCIKGWDNFNANLYAKVLIAKTKQLDFPNVVKNQTVKQNKINCIFANKNAIKTNEYRGKK